MSTNAPDAAKLNVPSDGRIAVVAARFNAEIVNALLEGCINRLEAEGIRGSRLDVHRVPGAFELPVTAAAALRIEIGAVWGGDLFGVRDSGRYAALRVCCW